jgi:hypothetical protein
MAMEDHILSAAMRLSHGEDLDATMSQLHIDITACEDALARDLEAAHWFDLGIPTDRLTSHCSQPLPPAETEDSSASENAVKQDLDTETYLGECYSSRVKRTRLTH